MLSTNIKHTNALEWKIRICNIGKHAKITHYILTQERRCVDEKSEPTTLRRSGACGADGWPPRVHMVCCHCQGVPRRHIILHKNNRMKVNFDYLSLIPPTLPPSLTSIQPAVSYSLLLLASLLIPNRIKVNNNL